MCLPWNHKYTKWEDVTLYVRVLLHNGLLQGGKSVYSEPTPVDHQKRHCTVCNKKQVRRV